MATKYVTRAEIAERLRAKGQTEDQIRALFLAYDTAINMANVPDFEALAQMNKAAGASGKADKVSSDA